MISFCKDVLFLQNYLDKRNIPKEQVCPMACMLGRKEVLTIFND